MSCCLMVRRILVAISRGWQYRMELTTDGECCPFTTTDMYQLTQTLLPDDVRLQEPYSMTVMCPLLSTLVLRLARSLLLDGFLSIDSYSTDSSHGSEILKHCRITYPLKSSACTPFQVLQFPSSHNSALEALPSVSPYYRRCPSCGTLIQLRL